MLWSWESSQICGLVMLISHGNHIKDQTSIFDLAFRKILNGAIHKYMELYTNCATKHGTIDR